jgi:hypothetical protein
MILACVVWVAWRAQWQTDLTAPGMSLAVGHRDGAPLWSPPHKDLQELLAQLPAASEWRRVDVASVAVKVQPMWGDMLLDLLFLLIPATLVPGWLYRCVRGHKRDVVLHLAWHGGSGLLIGILLSVSLWLLAGGWGPPMPLPFTLLGGCAGLVVGTIAFVRKAAGAARHGAVHLIPVGLRWLNGGDDPADLCAHGDLDFRIHKEVLCDGAEARGLTLSAAALFLLRTLSRPHTAAAPVGEHLFPCCGFCMYEVPGAEDVLILGCSKGVNFDVEHEMAARQCWSAPPPVASGLWLAMCGRRPCLLLWMPSRSSTRGLLPNDRRTKRLLASAPLRPSGSDGEAYRSGESAPHPLVGREQPCRLLRLP